MSENHDRYGTTWKPPIHLHESDELSWPEQLAGLEGFRMIGKPMPKNRKLYYDVSGGSIILWSDKDALLHKADKWRRAVFLHAALVETCEGAGLWLRERQPGIWSVETPEPMVTPYGHGSTSLEAFLAALPEIKQRQEANDGD